MSMAFHPQMDGQSEQIIQTLEDMLRACVIDFGGNWDDHLPLVEFAYNNSYHASVKMPPYEILYGRKCRTRIETIRERLKAAQDKWKSYADNRRRPIEFNVGDFVMLKVLPWKGVMRFKNKEKLSSRFIRPFKILKRFGEVTYVLELPKEMRGRKSRQLRNKEISLVKVQWKHRKGTSIRWEPEEKMRIMYPHLFQE
ncbi:putative reverse transcriptase domain-containing protein [Tanacetum coccineum]